jgi:hypothetical protein
MGLRARLAALVLITTVLVPHARLAAFQSPSQTAASPGDPAVDAYTTFVLGKKLTGPADRAFVVAALDRLVSAVEALALMRPNPDERLLSSAHKVRRELRRLQPIVGDSPAQIKDRWNVFQEVAQLVADVSREIGPQGAHAGVTSALLTAADGLDYDYSLRSQPNNIEIYFDLASRALKQMMP